MRVDRASPLPLWAQVLEDLRARLRHGEFGERFPSDAELVESYGVSRQTVREAVRRLQQEGLIERARGRGSLVSHKELEAPLGTLYSLFKAAEEQGFVQESVVRYLERRTDEQAAMMLGCRRRASLVYLERLRLVDGQPVVLDCSWLPFSLAAPLLKADFRHTALYRELEERCGLHPGSGWEQLEPALPTPEQAKLLGMKARAPVFSFQRLACAGSLRFEWRHGVIRADRFRFVARFGDGRVNATFESSEPKR